MIAEDGQMGAHLPQPSHFARSTTAMLSAFMESAPVGQTATHCSQPMHLSLAMIGTGVAPLSF
jgi:hypothetical protein